MCGRSPNRLTRSGRSCREWRNGCRVDRSPGSDGMTVSIAAALTVWLITDDWLIAASVLVLGLIWWALRVEEGPPVLALAMSLQWVQVTIGLFYVYVTGRTLDATLMSDYRPMVVIGLGCVVAIVIGLWGGTRLVDRLGPPGGDRPEHALTFTALL